MRKKINPKELIAILLKNEIKNVIIGGVALNIYNSTRMTRDIDFAIKNLDQDKVIDIMYSIGYKIPVEIKNKPDGVQEILWAKTSDKAKRVSQKNKFGALNFYLINDRDELLDQIDFVFDNPVPFSKIMQMANKVADNPPIFVACLEHLKIMKEKRIKLKQHSDTDIEDVKYISKLQKNDKKKDKSKTTN